MPELLKEAIRDVKDFPIEGIVFKDISPILSDPALLQRAIDLLVDMVSDQKIDKVVGIDARGFIFAPAVAMALGAGFVPVRKQGKLPAECISVSYDLEYGSNTLEIHKDAILPGERVLVVDDLLATGGSAAAAIDLAKQLGGEVIGSLFLVELSFLNGRQALACNTTQSILTY